MTQGIAVGENKLVGLKPGIPTKAVLGVHTHIDDLIIDMDAT